MSMSVDDVFRLEMTVRLEAERIRNLWPDKMMADPAVSVEAKTHARHERQRADRFDQVGNLLCGLQADWTSLAPRLREGYLAMQPPRPKRDEDDEEASQAA